MYSPIILYKKPVLDLGLSLSKSGRGFRPSFFGNALSPVAVPVAKNP